MKKTIVCLFVCLFVGSANAAFIGNDVKLQYFYPNLSTPFRLPSTATVGSGIEFNSFVGDFNIDISNTNITAQQFFTSGTRFTSANYNGWVLSDANNTIDNILGVTINSATNMTGLDSSRLSFDSNSIALNWQGLSFNGDTVVSLDVQFASTTVPEPASIVLLSLGLAGIGFSKTRKAV